MEKGADPREEAFFLYQEGEADVENDCACPNSSVAFQPQPVPGPRFRQSPQVFLADLPHAIKVFFYSIMKWGRWS